MKKILAIVLASLFSCAAFAQSHSVAVTCTPDPQATANGIYKNGTKIATVTGGCTYTDAAVAAGDSISYAVSDVFADSSESAAVNATPNPVVVPGAVAPPPATNEYTIKPFKNNSGTAITSLNFSTTAGGATPAAQIFRVSDTSPIDPAYTVTTNVSWAKVVAPVTGATDGQGFQVSVTVSPTALPAGTYSGVLTVTIPNQLAKGVESNWSNSPQTLPINFIVNATAPPPPPTLTFKASSSNSTSETGTVVLGNFSKPTCGSLTWTPSGGSSVAVQICHP